MWLSSQLRNWRCLVLNGRRSSPRRRRPDYGPPVEALECRTLLTAYAAATAAQLIADINAGNTNGGTNTITLTAPTTSPYVLSAVNNFTDGPTALPVIKKGDNLTIVTGNGSTSPGDGDTIDAAGHGRLFAVASGASLTLQNVTLQNGSLFGSGVSAEGGAIFNQGSLTLIGATVQNNFAEGSWGANGLVTQKKQQSSGINGQAGGDAAGGGIWSSGTVTLEGGTVVQNNEALGGQGGAAGAFLSRTGNIAGNGGAGGGGSGGGIWSSGSLMLESGTVLQDNTAQGGAGGAGSIYSSNDVQGSGGAARGGGIYIAGGTADISGTTLGAVSTRLGNTAQGGAGSDPLSGLGGAAYGGAVYVAAGTVTMSGDTVGSSQFGLSQQIQNVAQGGAVATGSPIGVGAAYGGGIYAAGGNVTLTNDIVEGNVAGTYANFGTFVAYVNGFGGGIFIAPVATVSIDNSSLFNTFYNADSSSPDALPDPNPAGLPDGTTANIDGKYIVL